MKSRWNDDEAAAFVARATARGMEHVRESEREVLAMRAYTSRLLGAEAELVLHGGGNTSVKQTVLDFLGQAVDVLWIKGSGWDLSTIEPKGFAPVRMGTLRGMAELDVLSDTDMVRHQRAAMLDPDAPVPSIEAIMHAVIPLPWVDHTHADAVVTLSNAPHGEDRLRSLYGDRVIFVPYVMPGFDLAKVVRNVLREHDCRRYEGMVLLHHGVFTWGHTAQQSYERMVKLVDDAEKCLVRYRAWDVLAKVEADGPVDTVELAELRALASRYAGAPMVVRLDAGPEAVGFAGLPGVDGFATRGPVTPDHVIRTKRLPLVLSARDDLATQFEAYAEVYRAYFGRHAGPDDHMLDPAPRWVVWPGRGIVAIGVTVKDAEVVLDIARQTAACIQRGEALGGWSALSEGELFKMEYWELEQRKLRKKGNKPEHLGRVALVTGAAHGIGRAVVNRLLESGAAVVGLDRDPAVTQPTVGAGYLGVVCDVTDTRSVDAAVAAAVRAFGGIDLLVSNAGAFPDATLLDELSDDAWRDVLGLNLDSHHKVLRAVSPFLVRGVDASVVFVASKNAAAPGPGVGAYSVAKAGLTQLARVAALELGEHGVRVNVVHPDAVFDTHLWNTNKLEARAKAYGQTVEEYKKRNLLKREVKARDVANVVARLLSPEMGLTTGAQVPVDGGNIRVI